MTKQAENQLITCPHCGYESEDEELCQACGKMIEDKVPVRKVSLARGFCGIFTGLKEKGFHGEEIKKPSIGDPGAAPFFFDEEIKNLHE